MTIANSETLTAPGLESVPEVEEFRWRTLKYFNLYRMVVALFFVGLIFLRHDSYYGRQDAALFAWGAALYSLAALALVLVYQQFKQHLDLYLTVAVATDIVFLTVFMYASGGHRSGIPFMLVVALAGAGLVGQGRLTLFYAALAAIALLLEQALRVLSFGADTSDFSPIGFTCIGYFATAVSARLLAQRVIANEQLALRRGVALARQMRVSELVIRDMQDGVLVVDGAGLVQQSNPQAAKLLGAAIEPGTSLARFSLALADEMTSLGTRVADVSRTLRASRSGKPLMARLVRTSEEGDLVVYLEDLERVQRQAEQVKLAALGRLTAGIAHEIRNPLSAIGHAAELLREERDEAIQHRLTRIINENVRRMDQMVSDVLQLGRRDRVMAEAVLLLPFLTAFVEEFRAKEGIAAGVIHVVAAPTSALVFDRTHLNQILWNLLRNAMRYCSRSAQSIQIWVVDDPAAAASAYAERLELHIMDDGPGIDPSLLGQVFEPFVTTDSKGTGLGLYIARELCDANGAVLELLDRGEGGHFRLIGRKTEVGT